jgi:hypothetical protein
VLFTIVKLCGGHVSFVDVNEISVRQFESWHEGFEFFPRGVDVHQLSCLPQKVRVSTLGICSHAE